MCEFQSGDEATDLERPALLKESRPGERRTSSKAGGGVEDDDGRLLESGGAPALDRKVTKYNTVQIKLPISTECFNQVEPIIDMQKP